ncbi:MAG: hypothetical protein ASARMPREDX12_005046 [Alectoria sarmentosa]|nr:MAG: hypothetical protein ASARMPREDX12_005046 [Alectoria sarmentosa]
MLLTPFLLLTLALAAPLDLAASPNLTATNRCSSSPDWQAYAFLIEDCFTAIQSVYIQHVLQRPDEMYEFVAEGSYPETRNPWVRTPSEYTVNSCTLSIVMLSWFGPREPLPGRGSGRYEQSDTATFKDIWGAARVVERDCLLPTRRPGWDAVGSTSSIGVFLWATDSAINEQVMGRGGGVVNGLPALILAPNASNVTNHIDSTD